MHVYVLWFSENLQKVSATKALRSLLRTQQSRFWAFDKKIKQDSLKFFVQADTRTQSTKPPSGHGKAHFAKKTNASQRAGTTDGP